MTIQESLRTLGVTPDTLSAEEKKFLDEQGYLPLETMLSPAQVTFLGARLAELSAAEGEQAGLEVHQEEGTDRLANLVDKDPIFALCLTQPRLLAAMAHVLGPELKLSSFNSRAALPGQGLQNLHADFGYAVEPGDYLVCNSIWLLDDFTAENGATRIVPGSHRSKSMPHEVLPDAQASHPDQKLLLGRAGTVVVFNSHLWHGGTINQTDKPRRAMHAYFCRRDQKQQTNQKEYLRPATIARLSEAMRAILDV